MVSAQAPNVLPLAHKNTARPEPGDTEPTRNADKPEASGV